MKLFPLLFIPILFSCKDKKVAAVPTPPTADHSMHNMTGAQSGYCDSINAGLIQTDTLKGSPDRTAMNTIGSTHIHIEYSSPGVKDRVIWGGLVPYGKVWVTGAHHATTIRFYKDVMLDGKKIPHGVYAFFTIPGPTQWAIILNSRTVQHLADEYKQSEDVLRISVPATANHFTPRLTYQVEASDSTTGSISMAWDKLQVRIPVTTF